MVYFLSQMEKGEVDEFFVWIFNKCNTIKDEGYKGRIEKPVKYLHACWIGNKNVEECIFKGWVEKGETHFNVF